jgi:phosphoribosyl 1,2-cyclic phosphodiesterase
MESAGFRPSDVRAVVLTHPDSDHLHSGWTRAVGGLAGPRLFVRERHVEAVRSCGYERSWIDSFDAPFDCAGMRFEPLAIPHDSLGSTAFRIAVGNRCAAHATDCGRPTDRLVRFLSGTDVLLLESNYDPPMQLASGRSPYLIDRIMGGSGHLSNEQALGIAAAVDRVQPLSALVLLHLSRECNSAELVHRLYHERAPSLAARLTVTAQREHSRVIEPAAGLALATLFDA